jgi:hypothetical protein
MGELGDEGTGQLRPDVRVLRLENQSAEPAIDGDEVVFVAEPVRLPVEHRVHRQADTIDLSVERDVPRDRGALLVFDRNVLEAQFVLPCGPQHHVQLAEALIGEAEIALEVDVVARNAERLAGDGHLGRGIPEAGRSLNPEALASRRFADRLGLELRRGGRRHQHQGGGHHAVQANRKSFGHEFAFSGKETGPERAAGRGRVRIAHASTENGGL